MDDILQRIRAALHERYEVQRELGEGATARVFLAKDRKHDRLVALKVLRPELAAAIGTERFLREIRVAAQLNHPHVLTLHDSGEADGLLYYVMPHVQGSTLKEELARTGPMPLARALRLGRHIAEALQHAHERGVVHRDIKPANILLVEGEAVVADFGLAHSHGAADVDVTQPGTTMGTPLYMSPEQADPGTKVDQRTDVYGFGCVLFELITGRPPFSGATLAEVLSAHATEPVPSLRALRPDTPPELDALVARALAKQPADRFADGAELAQALAEAERLVHTAGERRAGRRRTRRVLLATSVVVIALLGWLAVTIKAKSEQAWVMDVGLPGIEAAEDDEEALALALRVEAIDPDNERLAQLWRTFSDVAEITTEPPGATVLRHDYFDDEAEWIVVGTTPVTARLPHSFQRFRFELDGYMPTEIGSHWYYLRGQTTRLAREGEFDPDLVYVPGGRVALNIPGLDHIEDVELGNCLVARHEVTNAEWKAFMEAGGYADEALWTEGFSLAGVDVSLAEARARFVDATGQTGPATWIASDHPDGEEHHPVAGVSWFEAMAYAASKGRSLPTVFHWNRAAETRLTTLVAPLSNYDGRGTAPVGQYAGTTAFGLSDMGGNVREWCLNPTSKGERAILGGGFSDQPYMFNDYFAQDPWDRSAINGLRTVQYLDAPDDFVRRTLDPPFRDFLAETPVSDEVFEVYLDLFRYDPLPLNAEVLLVDDGQDDYVAEKVAYDLPYGGERGAAYLYTPKAGEPPYPAVVYFPGSQAIHQDSSEHLVKARFSYLMKQGYALIHPIHKGTYERGTELASDYPSESQLYRDHVIAWGMDQARAIDYLESRPDVDATRLAYFGVSWGGAMGPVMLAIEPRFDVALLYVAGFCFQPARPEADAINYVTRVTVPTLMLNGRYDHFFPVETSQKPLFELLGTPDDRKTYFLTEQGHSVPREDLIRETLAWLERWLGAGTP
ncbi:MAG: bifunctional serine/threonine-protein kinase/formylglycine-generating enzyme family protein [Planctomycetota bacterium]